VFAKYQRQAIPMNHPIADKAQNVAILSLSRVQDFDLSE